MKPKRQWGALMLAAAMAANAFSTEHRVTSTEYEYRNSLLRAQCSVLDLSAQALASRGALYLRAPVVPAETMDRILQAIQVGSQRARWRISRVKISPMAFLEDDFVSPMPPPRPPRKHTVMARPSAHKIIEMPKPHDELVAESIRRVLLITFPRMNPHFASALTADILKGSETIARYFSRLRQIPTDFDEMLKLVDPAIRWHPNKSPRMKEITWRQMALPFGKAKLRISA